MSLITIKNAFFEWMDDIYNLDSIIKSSNNEDIEMWYVIWEKNPEHTYTYSAYVFWKTIHSNFGYCSIVIDVYDERHLFDSHFFQSLNEMKNDFNTESGANFAFPSNLF